MIQEPKKRKINPMLLNVILISGGLHLLALFIMGSITIVKYIIPDTQFEEPPLMEQEEPPPEVRVEIKQQPPSQNQPLQNLRIRQAGNIAVANVDVNLPNMEQSFTVSEGLGDFSGGGLIGSSSAAMSIGISNVSVFGLKSRSERILFAIDASKGMMTDDKGGIESYKVIKDEVTDMIGNLSPGTLFNIMLFDQKKVKYFKNQLVPAGPQIHQEVIRWITPINSNTNRLGLPDAPQPTLTNIKNTDVTKNLSHTITKDNEVSFITQVVLESEVDAIFLITGYNNGFQPIVRHRTEKEEQEWQQYLQSSKYLNQLREHEEEIPKMRQRIAATIAEQNKVRKEQGLPPRILSDRGTIYHTAAELGLQWDVIHPNLLIPPPTMKPRDLEKYFSMVIDQLYTSKNKEKPSLNVILLLAGDAEYSKQDEKDLRDYVRFFSGKHRVIRGKDEIRVAQSAQSSTN